MVVSEKPSPSDGEEKAVWNFLVRDFLWVPSADSSIAILTTTGKPIGKKVKFQLFEVLMTAVLAKVRPDYKWCVSPNRPDNGTDFIGRTQFLYSDVLKINASITIGGQCKKRQTVGNIVDEVSGSLSRMSASQNPTFFIVAFAANLEKKRLNHAQEILEKSHNRHCHIMERRQIEGLLAAHPDTVRPLLDNALSADEAERVSSYLAHRIRQSADLYEMLADPPTRVLAGQPFEFNLDIHGVVETGGGLRLRWRVPEEDGEAPAADGMMLIGPLGADHPGGAPVGRSATSDDDPLVSRFRLQFVNYAVGSRALGMIELVTGAVDEPDVLARLPLGRVQIVENVRPRFFDTPVRTVWSGLDEAWQSARTGAVSTVTVVGSGGSGKSRVVEEFVIEIRRQGDCAVAAKQANTLDHPRRLLTNLLIGLTDPNRDAPDLGEAVLRKIERYDPDLAVTAADTVRGLIGSAGKSGGPMDDQKLVAVLLLLIRAATRQRTLLLHLQDLHWCTADILDLLERALWQLEHLYGGNAESHRWHGVLIVLEGRIHEDFATVHGRWSTRTFEAMVERLGKPILRCLPFLPHVSEEFTRRLFEDRHSSQRSMPVALLELQSSIITLIHRTAGGNPFHILEQLKLLKHRGAVVQNPNTGLHYLVRPDAADEAMPPTVADAIRARWNYLRTEKPALAHLVWATALLSERVPAALFRRLWSNLGSDYSLDEIEGTEFLTVSGDAGSPVAMRHENYFQTLRRLELPPKERNSALAVYEAWFSEIETPTAQQSFDLARVLLSGETPDLDRVGRLLNAARELADMAGDIRLLRRVLASLLDEVRWARADRFLVTQADFLAVCDDEIQLCGAMKALGERDRALQRLMRLEEQIQQRLQAPSGEVVSVDDALQLKRYEAKVLSVSILMNNTQPGPAAELATMVAAEFDSRYRAGLDPSMPTWRRVELNLRHVHAVALALAGDLDGSLQVGECAMSLAADEIAGLEPALDIVSTYANILLARDPDRSEQLLRQTSERAVSLPESGRCRTHLALNLAMCLLLLAYRDRSPTGPMEDARLNEALALLMPTYTRMVALGRLSDAAAAALLIGLVHSVRHDGNDAGWFADAIGSAARARQMETLWRAHINLASCMHRNGGDARKVGEHARAAYEILMDSLSPYARPEVSHRFILVCVPLAHAVRFLIAAGDPEGDRALARLPVLQNCFADLRSGQLRTDRGRFTSHEWLRDGDYDYVIY